MTWQQWVLAATAGVIDFVGVIAGQVFVRGRELRDMRRTVYVEWMKTARSLASWVGDKPVQGSVNFEVPHPIRKQALNLVTTELGVVASRRVIREAQSYLDIWNRRTTPVARSREA